MKEDKIICEEVSNNGWYCKVKYKSSDESPSNIKWDSHLWEYLEFSSYIDPNLDTSKNDAMKDLVKGIGKIVESRYKDMELVIPGLSIFTQITKEPIFGENRGFFPRRSKLNSYNVNFSNLIGLAHRISKEFFRENVFGDYKWFDIPFNFSYEDPRKIRIYYDYQKGPTNIPVHDAGKTFEEILNDFNNGKEFSIIAINNGAHNLDLQDYAIGGSSRCNTHAKEIWGYANANSKFNWNCVVNAGTTGYDDYQAMIVAAQIHRLGKGFGVSGELVYNLIKNIDPKYKGFIHPGFFSKQVEGQLKNEELKKSIFKENS